MNPELENYPIEPLWHVQIAVLLAIFIYAILPDKLIFGPRFGIPILELALLIGLVISTPRIHVFKSLKRRIVSIILIALISIANIASLILLVYYLIKGGKAEGYQLLYSAAGIYLTNIIIFGLWYWEIDRGGPGNKHHLEEEKADFLFPQMSNISKRKSIWLPTFFDYIYVSATNATAFSPTDTMPLTHRAKLLMLIQAVVSLVTIALVAARAVNILS